VNAKIDKGRASKAYRLLYRTQYRQSSANDQHIIRVNGRHMYRATQHGGTEFTHYQFLLAQFLLTLDVASTKVPSRHKMYPRGNKQIRHAKTNGERKAAPTFSEAIESLSSASSSATALVPQASSAFLAASSARARVSGLNLAG
jgi:hypothetical protein